MYDLSLEAKFISFIGLLQLTRVFGVSLGAPDRLQSVIAHKEPGTRSLIEGTHAF